MSTLIENYYLERNIPKYLLESKLDRFKRNPDIEKEFESWISTGKYAIDGAIEIEGYTAKKLEESSSYLKGESAFLIMIELRENPEKALKQLKRGFKMK